jgi:hypothetical protein
MSTLIALLILLPGQAPAADEKPAKTTSLTVVHDNNSLPELVLVTLYQDGKPIRSRELKHFWADTVRWDKLSPGMYEAHMEARGFEKYVKRVFLTEEDGGSKVYVELEKKGGAVGGGPSIKEITDQLKALQDKVKALEAEVERLKKK